MRTKKFSRGTTSVGMFLVVGSMLMLGVQASLACLNKNPLMTSLQKKGVQIFASATASLHPTCQQEWSVHKSCCDHTSIKNLAQQETNSLMQVVKRVRDELKDATAQLVQAQKDFGDIQEASNKLNLAAANYNITRFNQDVQYLLNPHSKLALNQDACMNRTAALRTNSLCSICSGRSQVFFSSGKALMSLTDCEMTINICKIPWKAMIKLVESMAMAEELMNKIKAKFPEITMTISMENVRKLEAWLDAHRIKQELNDCHFSQHQTCPIKSAKVICENLISLQKPTFFEEAVNAVAADVPKIKNFKLISQQVMAKAALSPIIDGKSKIGPTSPPSGGSSSGGNQNGGTSPGTPVSQPTQGNKPTTSSTTGSPPVGGNKGKPKYKNPTTTGSQPLWDVGTRRLLETDLFNTNSNSSGSSGSGEIVVVVDVPGGGSSTMDFNCEP